jgi:hypothetical protein
MRADENYTTIPVHSWLDPAPHHYGVSNGITFGLIITFV